MAYNANYVEVRKRLRKFRDVKGLSLQNVEILSRGEFMAVTLGSWERGDRKPTLERLLFLCEEIYRIPISAVVSGDDEEFKKALINEITKGNLFPDEGGDTK
jgi:transcriptional regulator with XRE-family HTH domain